MVYSRDSFIVVCSPLFTTKVKVTLLGPGDLHGDLPWLLPSVIAGIRYLRCYMSSWKVTRKVTNLSSFRDKNTSIFDMCVRISYIRYSLSVGAI